MLLVHHIFPLIVEFGGVNVAQFLDFLRDDASAATDISWFRINIQTTQYREDRDNTDLGRICLDDFNEHCDSYTDTTGLVEETGLVWCLLRAVKRTGLAACAIAR